MCMEWDIELVQCVWSGTLSWYSVYGVGHWAGTVCMEWDIELVQCVWSGTLSWYSVYGVGH